VIDVKNSQCLASIDVFVLAGGLGTRIRPALGNIPKLLAPIGSRSYFDHLVAWLRSFGTRRIVLGLGVYAPAILNHLRVHPPQDVVVETVVEPSPLGTAGALRLARPNLHSDPVMVINGDSFADADLCRLLDRHRAVGTDATLLCADVADAGRYGRLILDGDSYVERFVEKDASFSGRAWINAGVYLMSARLLDSIAAGGQTSLERDVLEKLPPRSLAAFTGCDRFIDIGTPESLARAGAFFDGPRRAQ
jgi:mannose-1-phosphate guanylyltransferase